jgi:CRP-like cAMP-binding protein
MDNEILEIMTRSHRSQQDLEKLAVILKQSSFFKQQRIQKSSELLEIAKFLKYQYCPDTSIVFSYGDEGERFYFILQGSCEVLVPMLK